MSGISCLKHKKLLILKSKHLYSVHIATLTMAKVNLAAAERYAVVTGGNKGIGFEICKQLASEGITVVLTARDEKRGIAALEKLKGFGLSDNVVFHRLDVVDPTTIASLVAFVETRYGKLDILVNNAGTNGVGLEGDMLFIKEFIEGDLSTVLYGSQQVVPKAIATLVETLEDAENCLQTNYYGTKRMTEALLPLLQLSNSPRVVNISSFLGNLKLLTNEWAKQELGNGDSLTEETIEKVIGKFLDDFKERGSDWPIHAAAYKVSKAAVTAYTRVMAKKYPGFCINSVCPGFFATEMTCNLGTLTVPEGAASPVKLALLPDGGPSGLFFYREEVFPF